jgi:uncharacterized membrane protein
MSISPTISRSPTRQFSFIERIVFGLSRHWLLVVNLLIAVWVGLPWLAPAFMHWGWKRVGEVVYFLYSFQCHQLPERSYFLFGKDAMYSLKEIQTAWQLTTDPMILRQFVGNPEMGWKVAWSDRMVSMYTSILPGSLAYAVARKRLRPLQFRWFALLLLPMVVDGSTHMISDLAGIGQGFRDTNLWLQALTANAFPLTFYQGDALGSFNSWMRLITGVLFGLGLVWFAFPYLNESFTGGTMQRP